MSFAHGEKVKKLDLLRMVTHRISVHARNVELTKGASYRVSYAFFSVESTRGWFEQATKPLFHLFTDNPELLPAFHFVVSVFGDGIRGATVFALAACAFRIIQAVCIGVVAFSCGNIQRSICCDRCDADVAASFSYKTLMKAEGA